MNPVCDVDSRTRPAAADWHAAAPERSLAQRMEALENANRIRSARAQLKRDLKAGRATAIDVLDDVPEWAGTMKVFDLLLATPKYGRVKAVAVLRSCAISPSKTLGGLSQRQRGELIGLLRRRKDGVGPIRQEPRT